LFAVTLFAFVVQCNRNLAVRYFLIYIQCAYSKFFDSVNVSEFQWKS